MRAYPFRASCIHPSFLHPPVFFCIYLCASSCVRVAAAPGCLFLLRADWSYPRRPCWSHKRRILPALTPTNRALTLSPTTEPQSMPSPPLAPPLDGSICILPGFLDFHAEHNPDLPWALLASDQGTAVGSVSFLELANATHRVAHALRPELAGPDGQVVALIAHCDTVTYHALQVGMIRAGLIVRTHRCPYS